MIGRNQLPSSNFKDFILNLASENDIVFRENGLDRWCLKVSELAGDSVNHDEIQGLIVELRRQKVVSKGAVAFLTTGYLKEKSLNK